MKAHTLRFRQVHLDFHTSPAIPEIGARFDKVQWQQTLRRGHVNSITCFAVCHHGWNYNDSRVGARHPGLAFDLLRAQVDACKEIDVNAPIYLTAGINNRVAHDHPEWREVGWDGRYTGWARNVTDAGFHKLCFNSPYLEHLCALIREVAEQYPTGDGIFLDIISQGPCCCRWCLAEMESLGLDARVEADRLACAQRALRRYYEATTAACRSVRADLPVFHNSGHIAKGRRDLLPFFSHLELESLPTGGWGYDHFPMSARYAQGLGLSFLGMTGKFHTSWGEFGGYKHPNALRYECAAMLAFGAKCSVGDQLHPSSELDPSTYGIIGAAYAEVEQKEAWCGAVTSVADIGLLSCEAVSGATTASGEARESIADVGAGRLLLEGHLLFDVIDAEMPLERYRAILLPDEARPTPELVARLQAYVAGGGKLILAGGAAVDGSGARFLFDVGADCAGPSPFQPDYILPVEAVRPDFCASPLAMYLPSTRARLTDGASLGDVFDPYFNRTYQHFCSHQHAPPQPTPSGFVCGTRKGNLLYFAHPVFSLYRGSGAAALKAYVLKALRAFLGDDAGFASNLPGTARVSVMDQPVHRRRIVHLLYGTTVLRGGDVKFSDQGYCRPGTPIEIIEELLPLADVQATVRVAGRVARVTLEPQGAVLPFTQQGDRVSFTLAGFTCHQMVVLHAG